MGLLKWIKKLYTRSSSPALSEKLIARLNEADEEYMRAFATKSLRQLQNYVSRECAIKISRSVFSSKGRYFGAPKFRKTTWTLLPEEDTLLKVLKDVKFDSIRIGSILIVGVASNYQEEWMVDLSSDLLIIDISSR